MNTRDDALIAAAIPLEALLADLDGKVGDYFYLCDDLRRSIPKAVTLIRRSLIQVANNCELCGEAISFKQTGGVHDLCAAAEQFHADAAP